MLTQNRRAVKEVKQNVFCVSNIFFTEWHLKFDIYTMQSEDDIITTF